MQIDIDQLRSFIGLGVLYRGVRCCVVEVLEDGPALVLEGSARAHQTDQYGEPRRDVPVTYTVPVLHPGGEVNGEFLELQVEGSCPQP